MQNNGEGGGRHSAKEKGRGFWHSRLLLPTSLLVGLVILMAYGVLAYPSLLGKGIGVAASEPFFRQEAQNDRININIAAMEELMVLPGIGEKRAAAIVEHREKNGAFSHIEALCEVYGIGDKIVRDIEDFICV